MSYSFSQQRTTASSTIIQQAFAWMFGGLLATAGSALFGASSQAFQQALATNPILFYGLILGELALVFVISASITRLAPATAIALYLVYAVLNGLTFSSIFLVFTGQSIAAAFLSTALVFGAMSLYGYTTKKDLSGVGSIAMMALIGLIIASLVNLFLRSSPLSYLLSFGAILIFTLLTAYDTQKLKRMSESMDNSNLGIYGALTLYLDFINIFLSLLRIFGRGRD